MHPDLAKRRRVLLVTYHRYLAVDLAWNIAQTELRNWFPSDNPPTLLAIGNPGSSIRRLYEQRDRARHQLEVAHLKLEVAKRRLALRRQNAQRPPFRFIPLLAL